MQVIGEGLQMTTYFPERMCCPRCDHGFSYMAVGSYNTFGATFYTDGYIEGPMYDDQGRLFRCPQCRVIGWNDEFICEEPGDDEDELDMEAALAELQKMDRGEIVRVEDGNDTVRIWID